MLLVDVAESEPGPTSRRRIRGQSAIYVVSSVIVVLLVWQFVVWALKVSEIILPSPVAIANSVYSGRSLLPEALKWTLYATLLGFGAALVVAVVVATLVTEVEFLRRTLYPLVVGFQSMPHIGFAPLLIIWFGFGTASHAALGALVAFFPIFTNMVHGLEEVRGERLLLFKAYGAGRLKTIWKLRFPMTLPFLLAGADVGVIFAMLGVIVAEFLGSNQGMGFLLVQQGNNLNTPGVFAVLVVLAGVGFLLHASVRGIRSHVLRGT